MLQYFLLIALLRFASASQHCDFYPHLAETPVPTFPTIELDPSHPTVRIMDMIRSAAKETTVARDNHTSCMTWPCTTRKGTCEYCLPSIYLAGVSKGGTSALFDKLATHPDVQGYWTKEVNVFNKRAEHVPLFTNLSTFEPRISSIARGTNAYYLDGSVGSFRDLQSIAMLKKYAPNAKVIILVRDMRARLISWLALTAHNAGASDIDKHSIQHGKDMIDKFKSLVGQLHTSKRFDTRFIRDVLFQEPPLGYFLIGDLLIPWVQAFGDNLLILDHADLLRHPLEVLRRIEHFVGLREHTYSEEVLEEVVNMHGHWGWFDHNESSTPTLPPKAKLEKAGISFGVTRDAYLHDLLAQSACVMEKLVGWAPQYEE